MAGSSRVPDDLDLEDYQGEILSPTSSNASNSEPHDSTTELSQSESDEFAAGSVSECNRLSFGTVQHEEQQLVLRNREERRRCIEAALHSGPSSAQVPERAASSTYLRSDQDASATCRFSVALSGGGVRAASFQAGALWQLAESGHLKDVDYIAAVSGGSYIASAFASHILEAGTPPRGQGVDAWYRAVVARTIARMQSNTPYLARDLGKTPWDVPKDGSSLLPRAFDIPILVFVILLNTLMTPAFYVMLLLVPGVELFDVFLGGQMRRMYCNTDVEADDFGLYHPASMLNVTQAAWAKTFCTFLFLTFVFWLLARVPPKECTRNRTKHYRRRRRWLFLRSSAFALTRIIVFLVGVYLVMMVVINYRMWMSAKKGLDRFCKCNEYWLKVQGNSSIDNQYNCSDSMFTDAYPEYATENFNFSKCKWLLIEAPEADHEIKGEVWRQCGGKGWSGPTKCVEGAICVHRTPYYSQCVPSQTTPRPAPLPAFFANDNQVSGPWLFLLWWTVGLIVAVLLIPFFPKLYGCVLGILGPATAFLILAIMVHERVFGAIVHGPEYGADVQWFVRVVLMLDVVLVPFQHITRGHCHRMYRRSLRLAFFAGGEDRCWHDLRGNPFCPLLLITATISEFMRPGDSNPLSEISMSPLHVGSLKTGYTEMPSQRSLSRSVALSGAAVDAFVLGKKDHIKYRFWLEMLALSMGDFMSFDRANRCLASRTSDMSKRAAQFTMRMPSFIFGVLFYLVLLLAVVSSSERRCRSACSMYTLASVFAACLILLSFYAFVECFDPLMHCLPIRGIHLLTRFYHRAEVPPSLVCVTDGGLLDNTGVMQLLRRRCKRILLVYGGNDPKGKFKWLRKVLDGAANERIASFHDPRDVGLDFREILQDFNEDLSKEFLHLRIRYGWVHPAGRFYGDLFVVTNRLSSDLTDLQVLPLLTEGEVRGDEGDSGELSSGLESMHQTKLGGCCCDCCHSHGCNFGSKFPNTHQMNQCLTPQLFNCLCRLGHRSARGAVEAVATLERHHATHPCPS